MKTINKYIASIMMMTSLMSCGDELADLNKNPNASTSGGSGAEVFVAATGYYGIALDGYFNERDALFAQYWAGGVGVNLTTEERYFFEPADFNVDWSLSCLQALSDYDYVINSDNEARAAAAEIMSVLIYQNLVDHFGDIPYTNALKGGDGELAPTYSDDAEIYSDLVTRLDNSISVLSTTSDVIGAEDLIYGGNLSQWVAFANSLKLRILMRQSITNPSAVGSTIVDLINNGSFIETTAGMPVIPFDGGATNNWNPQYSRRESGIGQFYCLSQSLLNVFNTLDDPRLNALFDYPVNSPSTHNGMLQGNVNDLIAPTADDFSYPTSVQYAEDNGVILMSNWEVMFLRSEAAMRFSTGEDEEAMFNNAIAAHFDYIGAGDASNYISEINYSASNSEPIKTNMLAIQKWISFVGLQESEGWIESRRFDRPGNNIFTNTTNGIFSRPTRSVFGPGVYPTIYLYPQSELSFNQTNVPARTNAVTDKVFWDN